MNYILELTAQAEEDLCTHAKAGNRQQLKKILSLFEELKDHPETGTGQPEQLKHNLSGYWSRRIDRKHCLIYTIEEEKVLVTVTSAFGHYK